MTYCSNIFKKELTIEEMEKAFNKPFEEFTTWEFHQFGIEGKAPTGFSYEWERRLHDATETEVEYQYEETCGKDVHSVAYVTPHTLFLFVQGKGTYAIKEDIKALGGKWIDKTWRLEFNSKAEIREFLTKYEKNITNIRIKIGLASERINNGKRDTFIEAHY